MHAVVANAYTVVADQLLKSHPVATTSAAVCCAGHPVVQALLVNAYAVLALEENPSGDSNAVELP